MARCTWCSAEATTTFSPDFTIPCCPACHDAQHAALSRIAQENRHLDVKGDTEFIAALQEMHAAAPAEPP